MQIDLDALERDVELSIEYGIPFEGLRRLRAAFARLRELEQENATLRAVAAEYDACIRHMDAGGDFHEFQRVAIAAQKKGDE